MSEFDIPEDQVILISQLLYHAGREKFMEFWKEFGLIHLLDDAIMDEVVAWLMENVDDYEHVLPPDPKQVKLALTKIKELSDEL